MKIGVIGAGQLGRMLALAGYPLGLEFVFLDPSTEACALKVGTHIQGAYDDPVKLRELASQVDLITYEFENVPTSKLDAVAKLTPFYPPVTALGASQDRLTEKNLFRQLGIPTPEYRAVDSLDALQQAVSKLGMPGILKTRRLGYDGRGQFRIKKPADVLMAWKALQPGAPLIYEAFVNFDREVSLIGARNRQGDIAFYPLTENEHRDGILHLSRAPYRHTSLLRQAKEHLNKLLEHFEYVGVLTVEFFVVKGQLVANEMAPRVHNSGHWTIEGAETSQFENHLRAICGWPLGNTSALGHVAMLNFVGHMPTQRQGLKIDGSHWHDYGKPARPGRKLGHATVVKPTAMSREYSLKRLRKATGYNR